VWRGKWQKPRHNLGMVRVRVVRSLFATGKALRHCNLQGKAVVATVFFPLVRLLAMPQRLMLACEHLGGREIEK